MEKRGQKLKWTEMFLNPFVGNKAKEEVMAEKSVTKT